MLRTFFQWLKYRKTRPGVRSSTEQTPITGEIRTERENIIGTLGGNRDVKTRTIAAGGRRFLLAFIDGMADMTLLNEAVVKPLLLHAGERFPADMEHIVETVISAPDVTLSEFREEAVRALLFGDSVLFAEGLRVCAVISSKGYAKRSVEKPENEIAVRGPKESFTENLRTNTALLRRKIRNENLVFEEFRKGRQTHTAVTLVYLKNIAEESLIEELRRRLGKIDIDMILETGYVEQLIEDRPLSIFATVGYTEKPDVAAAKLMEGRAAILVDGTPFALTAPYLMIEAFQHPEDYYTKPYYATLIRFFRVLSFLVSIFAPALFVALTTFHQELIPTALLFTMAAAREGIPFTAVTETMIMLLTFEILREAGLRLPQAIGQTISIVGALVMGDAAIAAGLVGAPLVITIAFTAVCTFAVPALNDQQTLLRWLFLAAASLLGGFGIALGVILLVLHVISLRSFGYGYLAPFAPFEPADLKDTVIRAPLWLMRRRPFAFTRKNKVREDTRVPGPSREEACR